MALQFHPNRPDPIDFPCPGCGRNCVLTPMFNMEPGAAYGTRHGHSVKHALPTCHVYDRMTPQAFMILSTSEIPWLNADPHISVKQPDAAPLIIADMAQAQGRAEVIAAAERQQVLDIEAAKAEAIEIAHRRDELRAEGQRLERARRRARRRDWTVRTSIVFAVAVAVGSAYYCVMHFVWGLR